MSRQLRALLPLVALGLLGCDSLSEPETANFRRGLRELRGGVVFAAASLPGSKGYDLWWAPIPPIDQLRTVQAWQLTSSSANEQQPALARSALGLAFVREDGIYFIGEDDRLRRLTDTDHDRYVDIQPALSSDARSLAWTRVDTHAKLAGGAHPAYIMVRGTAEGSEARAVFRRDAQGVNQVGAVFHPTDPSRLAWAEQDMATGATAVVVSSWQDGTRSVVCEGTAQDPACRATSLRWPVPETLVATRMNTKTLTELPVAGGAAVSQLAQLQKQIEGAALTPSHPDSVAYPQKPLEQEMLLALFLRSMLGDEGVAFYLANHQVQKLRRLNIQGYTHEPQVANTDAGLPIPIATPQIVGW